MDVVERSQMQKTHNGYRKFQVQNIEYGSYKLRVGDLWENDSKVIVITDIYQHMTGNNEWLTVHYRSLDDLDKEYISERIVHYIERNNFAPIP